MLRRDSRRAYSVLDAIAPIPETGEEKEADSKEYAIVCPKCHSEEVIFEGNDPGETDEVSAEKFNWICGECDHEWKDDGIEQAV